MRKEILVNSKEEMDNKFQTVLHPILQRRTNLISRLEPQLTEIEAYFLAVKELIEEEKLPILTYKLSEQNVSRF